MVVEMLTFAVAEADRAEWLRVEEQVWSRFLERQPGFVRKEMWVDVEDTASVHAMIWWESLELWQAISAETVAAVDAGMGEWFREGTLRTFQVVRES
jgi:uncharacterized protein (TIGR03792 family)